VEYNIDKSFEKVKYSIKTQLRKVVTEKYGNISKEKLSSSGLILFVFNLEKYTIT
jgi:hypothetical protein